MYKARLYAAFFIVLLVVLSLVQILVDAYSEHLPLKSAASGDADAKKNYCIFIEIEDKTLYLLEDGVRMKEYSIASGKSGSPSPLGCWKIVEKGDWGEGFGGRWMGLDVTWGTYQSGLN